MERVDATSGDDARPEPAPAGAQPRPSRRWRTARGCSATPRTCRSPTTASTATSPPARSSTGRTRSAGIAEAYRVTRAGGDGADDRPGPPGQPRRPRAGRDVDAVPARSRSTRAGWRPPGFTDVRVRELAPDWYRDARAPVRAGGDRRQARARARRRPRAPPPAGRGAASSRVRFAARFVAGSAAGAAFIPIAAALTLRDRAAREGARPPLTRRRAPPPRARANPRSLVLWRFARPHTLIGTALSVVGLYADRRRRGATRRRRRRPAGHAGRRPDGQHRDRRRQPAHRRRDRPRQQAVPADRRR